MLEDTWPAVLLSPVVCAGILLHDPAEPAHPML